MAIGGLEVELSLSTLCGGELEKRFQDLYPNILSALKDGEKATVGITLEFSRIKDMSTMVNVGYKIKQTMPAQGRASICQVTADNKLKTDKPVPQPEQIVINMPPSDFLSAEELKSLSGNK